MELSKSIIMLSALAHESRLVIFKQLVQAGHVGMQPNHLSSALNMPPATLSFHLKELFHADLVSKEKQGRAINYTAQFKSMNDLIEYLKENCCSGSSC